MGIENEGGMGNEVSPEDEVGLTEEIGVGKSTEVPEDGEESPEVPEVKELSLEEILAAQRKFEAEVRSEKEKDAAKAIEAAQALVDIGSLDGIRDRIRVLDEELRSMNDIKVRIEQSAQLADERRGKEEQLAEINASLDQFRKRLAVLNNIPTDKIIGVSDVLQRQIDTCSENISKTTTEEEAMRANIDAIRAKEVPETEIDRYKRITTEMAELKAQATTLYIENPAVEGELYEEAEALRKDMVELQESIIKTAKEISRYPASPERTEFVKAVCERFFQEEITAGGFELKDKFKDEDERKAALTKLANNIRHGLRSHGLNDLNSSDASKENGNLSEQAAGLALANLIGVNGTGDAAIMHLTNARIGVRYIVSAEDDAKWKDASFEQTMAHLGTLNYIRAYAAGLGQGQARTNIMGAAETANSSGRDNSYSPKIGMVIEGKPILPEGLSDDEKQRITAEFDKVVEKSRAIAERKRLQYKEELERIYLETRKVDEEKLSELEAKLDELKQKSKKAEVAEGFIKENGSAYDIQKLINEKRDQLKLSETELSKKEQELKSSGFFSRKRLTEAVGIIKQSITELQRVISDLVEKHKRSSDAQEHSNAPGVYLLPGLITATESEIANLTQKMKNDEIIHESRMKN